MKTLVINNWIIYHWKYKRMYIQLFGKYLIWHTVPASWLDQYLYTYKISSSNDNKNITQYFIILTKKSFLLFLHNHNVQTHTLSTLIASIKLRGAACLSKLSISISSLYPTWNHKKITENTRFPFKERRT